MLQQFATAELFAFMLIFCRVGAGIMVLPGFSETYVSARIRLLMALSIALVLTPMLGERIPPPPSQPVMLVLLLAGEILIGLLIGGLARILISAVHTAGTVIATQSSLASAMLFDLTMAGQSTVVSNLLTYTAVVLIFSADLHHLMLSALVDSYTLFTPGAMPPAAQFAQYASNALTEAFAIALQLSAPHIAIGMILYLGAGVLSRVMPNIQIFFIMMPPQIMIALSALAAVFSGMMLWYLRHFEDALLRFISP